MFLLTVSQIVTEIKAVYWALPGVCEGTLTHVCICVCI